MLGVVIVISCLRRSFRRCATLTHHKSVFNFISYFCLVLSSLQYHEESTRIVGARIFIMSKSNASTLNIRIVFNYELFVQLLVK